MYIYIYTHTHTYAHITRLMFSGIVTVAVHNIDGQEKVRSPFIDSGSPFIGSIYLLNVFYTYMSDYHTCVLHHLHTCYITVIESSVPTHILTP